jgi:WXG100 family type VII secretion target
MAQAIIDPEEVRRFAEELKRFVTDLQNQMGSLQGRFAALSDTWQDQEHEKFAEEFVQSMKAMKKFIEVSSHHGPFLLRKAQRIEDYLSQR